MEVQNLPNKKDFLEFLEEKRKKLFKNIFVLYMYTPNSEKIKFFLIKIFIILVALLKNAISFQDLTSYLGVDSLYGYENLNFWIFSKEKGKDTLKKLTPQEVIKKIEEFLDNPKSPSEFKLSFLGKK